MATKKKAATKARKRAAAPAKPKTSAARSKLFMDLPMLHFATAAAFRQWLEIHHASSQGIWIKLGRRASGRPSITRAEAVDGALRYGWIDGQGRSLDETHWLMKFTPRRARSLWSKINRELARALIERGLMRPAGLAEVERAKRDGRWDVAYDSSRTAKVPDDLTAALASNARAAEFFATLNAANRYAILWRLQTAKRAETRARRLAQFVEMLARGEKLHP